VNKVKTGLKKKSNSSTNESETTCKKTKKKNKRKSQRNYRRKSLLSHLKNQDHHTLGSTQVTQNSNSVRMMTRNHAVYVGKYMQMKSNNQHMSYL